MRHRESSRPRRHTAVQADPYDAQVAPTPPCRRTLVVHGAGGDAVDAATHRAVFVHVLAAPPPPPTHTRGASRRVAQQVRLALLAMLQRAQQLPARVPQGQRFHPPRAERVRGRRDPVERTRRGAARSAGALSFFHQ